MTTKPTHNNSNNKQTNKQTSKTKRNWGKELYWALHTQILVHFMWIKLISIWKSSHYDSLWNRGERQLGNRLFSREHHCVNHVANTSLKATSLWTIILCSSSYSRSKLSHMQHNIINTQGRHVVNSLGTDILNAWKEHILYFVQVNVCVMRLSYKSVGIFHSVHFVCFLFDFDFDFLSTSFSS